MSLPLLACVLSCNRNDNPQAAFDRAYRALLRGDVKQAEDEAHREGRRSNSSAEWAWKFRALEARAMLHQGRYEDALDLLNSDRPPSDPDLLIPILTIEAAANVNAHHFPEAEQALNHAEDLCRTSASASCGYVLQARGLLAIEQAKEITGWESAERQFESSLAFARLHNDKFLESDSLLNLGNLALAEGRFDEAIDRSEVANQIAKGIEARILELITEGNIGWANYKLGDLESALDRFLKAEKLAAELGNVDEQAIWLTDAGYVHMDRHEFAMAEQNFRQALQIEQAPGVNSKENIYNALRVMARLALQTGDLANASQYAERAVEIARQDGNRLDELYPMLVQSQIAARRGDTNAAETTFQQVEGDKLCPVFLKWEAEHSLARLYEDEKRPDFADHEYRAALATFEAARDTVQHQDSQLSFLTNASRIYDDYVHFLVTSGKTDEALRWADYSRARTLAEGLGLLPKSAFTGPPPLNPQQIARRAEGTILFYWLGEKQAYLWVITPQKTSLFTLPPGPEIETTVERYRKALGGPQDVLKSADQDGRSLYRKLIAPAQALLKRDAKVFVIPDGTLNNLNFETLIVSEPEPSESVASGAPAAAGKLHYWIEDVTIANASSLRVLGASRWSGENRDRSLLLVGDSIPPNDKYPELPQAAAQMESVARHFPAAERRVIAREQATPAAYLASNPEQFSYIHFVAHGIARRLSPLDSAIVLSKIGLLMPGPSSPGPSSPGPSTTASLLKAAPSKTAPSDGDAENDSFKLYARDIIRPPRLRAELVTISACYGAGERAYSGEGLVGLSWAFLRAGAHNVVAALWEATDASTEQLMNNFYDELDKGARPDAALRDAKLSLLRGSAFHNPFYWAPFQLYTGS